MESSTGVGFMTVFAVSGSVVLFALQIHKRLLSEFMKKLEFELGGSEKDQRKKKVRFAEDVVEPSSNNKEYRKRRSRLPATIDRNLAHVEKIGGGDTRVLYKGIGEYKTLKAQTVPNFS